MFCSLSSSVSELISRFAHLTALHPVAVVTLCALLPIANPTLAQHDYEFIPWFYNWPSNGGEVSYDMPDQTIGTTKTVRVWVDDFAGNNCWLGPYGNVVISAEVPDHGTLEIAWEALDVNGNPTGNPGTFSSILPPFNIFGNVVPTATPTVSYNGSNIPHVYFFVRYTPTSLAPAASTDENIQILITKNNYGGACNWSHTRTFNFSTNRCSCT